MADSARTWLKRQLADVLIPAFHKAGFVSLALDGDDAKSAEIRASFPFGRLRRPCPGGFHQVEVQLDKHQPAAFRINFGFVAAEGIRHAVGPVAVGDIWIHYLSEYSTLYSRAWTRRWFSVDRAAAGQATEADYRILVQSVVALLPELERALDPRVKVPWTGHVRRVTA